MTKAGRIGAILILTLGFLDLTAILFASQRGSAAEPVRLERAAAPSPATGHPACLDDDRPLRFRI
jgi:hypothetical protein